MTRSLRSVLLTGVLMLLLLPAARPAAAAPEGTLTWAVHISLAPTFFVIAGFAGVLNAFQREPGPSVAGAAIIAAGVPLYFLVKTRLHRAQHRLPLEG